eukprot:m.78924 g.78924  ORF g.78924 m.78924 type:complete len:97 (+) comp14605_c1_seq1:197-487(+)
MNNAWSTLLGWGLNTAAFGTGFYFAHKAFVAERTAKAEQQGGVAARYYTLEQEMAMYEEKNKTDKNEAKPVAGPPCPPPSTHCIRSQQCTGYLGKV